MSKISSPAATAFDGIRLLSSGALSEVALAVRAAMDGGAAGPILVFDDLTGRVIDLDLRGSDSDILARLAQHPNAKTAVAAPVAPSEAADEEFAGQRGRGRPKLGVVAREVTLLPRQWEWLSAQPGGASAVLRRLVDDARRAGAPAQQKRAAQEAAYRVMSAIAGDLPGYEEATRALFAGDGPRLHGQMSVWPADISAYVARLATVPHDPPINR